MLSFLLSRLFAERRRVRVDEGMWILGYIVGYIVGYIAPIIIGWYLAEPASGLIPPAGGLTSLLVLL